MSAKANIQHAATKVTNMLYLSSGVLFVGSSANQLEDLGMLNCIKSLLQVTIYIYLHCWCSVYSNPTKLIQRFGDGDRKN